MGTTLPPQSAPVVVNKTTPSSLYDAIDSATGRPQDMTGATIDFSMRQYASRTPVLIQAAAVPLAPPDLEGHNVRYDWQSSDVSNEGQFFGWWGYALPGHPRVETLEFLILITDHGPGTATETGAIVDGARMYMPVTFSALQRDVRFGDSSLQRQAELIKRRVLGYTILADQEENLDIVLLDFLSKRLALELINPGIDFWSRQMRTATSSATSEITAYPDMIASLKLLRENLCAQLTDDWSEIQLLVPGTPNHKVVAMPTSSLLGYPNVTRNPQHNQRLETGRRVTHWFDEELGLFPFP